ncbi:MAG: NTP transferase domain-containing protein [Burkholderiaceae bacterium]|nr:NTP transferase domain-containing protein [Burkholderiaceae bacterium]
MLLPAILSGGGTRLWPVSRESYPKPFIRLGGGESLLPRTLLRASTMATERLCIVANEAYAFKTSEEVFELPALDRLEVTQLLEPIGRNTATAIALAAHWGPQSDPDAAMFVLPADHLIADVDAFARAATAAALLANQGEIVLFGISPSAPETGFGYLDLGDALGEANGYRVRQFVEKPDLKTALRYSEQGDYAWNSGMFCFRADVLLDALSRHAPDVPRAAQGVWKSASSRTAAGGTDHGTPSRTLEVRFARDAVAALPDISIDYALMERAEQVVALRPEFGWSDIGSWRALAEQLPADEGGNTTVGKVKPGASLSMQMHHHRSEHRLHNLGKLPLVMIEPQRGDYVGEDDIVRFNDLYGRATSPVDT